MLYENVVIYLNEEVRKPIKSLLKHSDKKTQKEVMEIVDYLCDKYRETNGLAAFYEEQLDQEKEMFKKWLDYASKNGLYRQCDYDAMTSPFSWEEEDE